MDPVQATKTMVEIKMPPWLLAMGLYVAYCVVINHNRPVTPTSVSYQDLPK